MSHLIQTFKPLKGRALTYPLLFSLLITSSFSVSAKTRATGDHSNSIDSRLITVVSDTKTEQPICAVVYDKSAIKNTDIPECEGENLALAEAVKPHGVDIAAMNSYFQTALVACTYGHYMGATGNDEVMESIESVMISHDKELPFIKPLRSSTMDGAYIGESLGGPQNPMDHTLIGSNMAMLCSIASNRVFSIFRGE